MSDEASSPVWRRLAEAEERVAAYRDALLMAGLQGRTHLLPTLHAMIQAEENVIAALRAGASESENGS